MVSLKEAVDRPINPPGHVYFSLSDEEIPSDEWVDIKLEQDGSIIRGTPLLVDIPSSISCHLLLNLLDDTLHMLKYIHTYIHTYESLRSLFPMILFCYYQHKRLLKKTSKLHVRVRICVNCKQNCVGERERG